MHHTYINAIIIVLVVITIVLVVSILMSIPLEVTRYKLKSHKIPKSFSGKKILQLSDLHCKEFGKDNIKIINIINENKPDVIFVTGDMIDGDNKNYESVLNLMKYISQRYKVYYITGNHEHKALVKKYRKEYMEYFRELKKLRINRLNNRKIVVDSNFDIVDNQPILKPKSPAIKDDKYNKTSFKQVEDNSNLDKGICKPEPKENIDISKNESKGVDEGMREKAHHVEKEIENGNEIDALIKYNYTKNDSMTDKDTINIYSLILPFNTYRYLFSNRNVIKVDYDYIRNKLGDLDRDDYNILLSHNPLYFPSYVKWGTDLVFSGHVHGGIIRLPFFGGLLSPDRTFFPKYCCGEYKEDNTTMYVTRGLGGSAIRVRINNRPEIIIVEIQ